MVGPNQSLREVVDPADGPEAHAERAVGDPLDGHRALPSLIAALDSSRMLQIGSGGEIVLPEDRVPVLEAEPALALPEMLRAGAELEFALIDGDRPFDELFLQFIYLDRLLGNGGVLAIASADGPAARAIVEFAAEARVYEPGSPPGDDPAILRKLGRQRSEHVPDTAPGRDRRNPPAAAMAAADGATPSQALFLARARADELEERNVELGLALVDAEQRAGDLLRARADLLRARAELRDCRALLSASQGAHEAAEHWLASIQASPSWRMTAPLRALKRYVRG